MYYLHLFLQYKRSMFCLIMIYGQPSDKLHYIDLATVHNISVHIYQVYSE